MSILGVGNVSASSQNDSSQQIFGIGPQPPIQQQTEESGHEYLIVLPFIVLFGLLGNTISLVAILHSRLRKMPANQYLVVLTIADSVFLFGIILLLFKVDFVGFIPCVLVEYVLMTSSYVSSWSIAALTLERYLAIAHPLKHVQYGHISRWKAMACWLPLPFLLNLVQFYSLSPPTDPDMPVRKCEVKDGQIQMIAELSDVLLCYCLPCCIVVVLNLVIASKVRSADRNFATPSPPLKKPPSSHPMPAPLHSSTSLCPTKSAKFSIGSLPSRKSSSRSLQVPIAARSIGGSASPASAGTRILLVVPIVYILLNTPFYLFRILDTVAINVFQSEAFQGEGLATNPALAWLYNVAHYLYYVNFACDVLVYAFSSANFRRTVLIAWRRLLCPGWAHQQKELALGHTSGRFGTNATLGYQQSTKRLLNQSPCQAPKIQQAAAATAQNQQNQQQRKQRVSLEVDGEEARRSLMASRYSTK